MQHRETMLMVARDFDSRMVSTATKQSEAVSEQKSGQRKHSVQAHASFVFASVCVCPKKNAFASFQLNVALRFCSVVQVQMRKHAVEERHVAVAASAYRDIR